MSKRCAITGLGGAIGVHLMAHIFTNTDWEIVGIDSFRHKGYYDRITRFCKNHPDWPPRLTVVSHDLCAPLTDRQIDQIGKIDYILNLASLSDVQGSIDDPVPFIRNNSDLMLNILEYARKAKPEVFLHFSTDETYGPTSKDSDGHKEWDVILPSNPYSASKAAQEAYAIAYWRSYGVPLIITNTMNNFGETQSPSKFPAMVQQQLNKGETVKIHAAHNGEIGTRYYLHSRNAADAVLFILQNTTPHLHQPGEIDRPDRYNIVGDKQVDNLELAQTIAKLMGKELRYKLIHFHNSNPGHDLSYGLDGKKLADLGWKSPMSFEESLKNVIDWQQRNPEWLK
jgi:dTDP-glucose 4,6-dehydratase